MQSSSIICSSSNCTPLSHAYFRGRNQINSGPAFSFPNKSPLNSLHIRRPSRSIVNSTGFVETGYIYGVHGFQGEVRVKPSTDFPDLRFSKPGTRWLKQQVSGTETVKKIDLVEGRGHSRQSWIVKFTDINTVEQARKIIGSTILVTDQDRPVLDEDEFYNPDLIGMRVILKESREPIGTVVDIFNNGANDLLHVKLSSVRNFPIQKSKTGERDSGPLVWVPFVQAIVPIVDMEEREMLITPPNGLLELNIRSDDRSKKERRELEWKERKKFQRRLISAKKKLCEMEQQHVFHGFKHGEKDQKSLLANQIVRVKSKLLQQALESIEIPSTSRVVVENVLLTFAYHCYGDGLRLDEAINAVHIDIEIWHIVEMIMARATIVENIIGVEMGDQFLCRAELLVALHDLVRGISLGVTPNGESDLLYILSAVPRSNTLRVYDSSGSAGSRTLSDPYCRLQRKSCLLTSNGKAAIVLVLEETEKISDINRAHSSGIENSCLLVKALLDDDKRFVKIEDRTMVPLILVSPAGSVNSLRDIFVDHDYFAFDPVKVSPLTRAVIESKRTEHENLELEFNFFQTLFEFVRKIFERKLIVWFLEEEKLPLVSSMVGGHKILMKSPWEILQRPIGSGSVISLFSSHESLLDQLSEMGVEYIEACKVEQKCENGRTLNPLLGLVDSHKANVGIRLFNDISWEEDFDVIFSTSFLRKLTRQTNKLQFVAVPCCNSHVEKVDKDWINVIPTAPNSYEFRSSIYCFLDATPINKVCLLDCTD
ncbi:hypothetical protein OROHE_025552 [Orobanche hederae]